MIENCVHHDGDTHFFAPAGSKHCTARDVRFKDDLRIPNLKPPSECDDGHEPLALECTVQVHSIRFRSLWQQLVGPKWFYRLDLQFKSKVSERLYVYITTTSSFPKHPHSSTSRFWKTSSPNIQFGVRLATL